MSGPKCACGWPRPVVAVRGVDGSSPREDLVVAYPCPQCGTMHICGETDAAGARVVFLDLLRELGDVPATFAVHKP